MLDSTIREVRKRAWELWESEEEEERLEGCQMLRSTGIQPDLLLAGDWFCAIGEFIDAISCWKEAAEKWEDFEAITKLMNWFLKEGDSKII
jgi:hypothetical protein